MARFGLPLLALLLVLAASPSQARRKSKIKLSEVTTLTLSSTKMTHSTEMPQLQCTSGCTYSINQAQCKNAGLDDMGDVNWECEALMPKGCKFVTTEVKCKYVDDDYIVPGSCLMVYSLECDRVDDGADEERELRSSIVTQKKNQQRATAEEVERIRVQAEADKCELAQAAARYQVGGDAVDAKTSNGWSKGRVARIDCRGRYDIQLDTGRTFRGVDESEVRLHQKTVTREEDVYEERYVGGDSNNNRNNRNNRDRDRHGSTPDVGAKEMMYGLVAVVAIAFLMWLLCDCKQTISRSSVVSAFMAKPGNRMTPREARDHFKEALGREKEAGESKLNQIINQVCDKATVAGQGETLLLKAHIIEEELERKRRAERQQQMAAVAAAAAAVNNNNNNSYNNNGGGGGGGQVIRQRVGTKTVDDEVATEQAREAREKVLAAQAVLRVAAVKAKQDRGEAAKVAEFQTKMDQLQRDLQNDTAQLGNAMARYDRVMEQYKSSGFSTTGEY